MSFHQNNVFGRGNGSAISVLGDPYTDKVTEEQTGDSNVHFEFLIADSGLPFTFMMLRKMRFMFSEERLLFWTESRPSRQMSDSLPSCRKARFIRSQILGIPHKNTGYQISCIGLWSLCQNTD